MRVVSWNMGMANSWRRRPGLHDQAWHFLLGLGADLAFVQEAVPPAWVRGEGTLVYGPISRWGSAIFSPRYPLEPFRLPDGHHLRELGAYLACCRASLPDGSEPFLASVHAAPRTATSKQLGDLDPTKLRRSNDGPRVNDVIFWGLADLVGTNFIVGGDWNTARVQGTKQGSAAGQAFFDRASARGWYDCVANKAGKQIRTWFREGDRLAQDDHVFCDERLGGTLRAVRGEASAVTELGLSDHGPLILDFVMPSIAMMSLTEQPQER